MRRLGLAGTAAAVAACAAAATAAPANRAVEIVDRAYQPSLLTVNVGETVTWTNTTLMPHTVTAVDGSFDSGTMNGQTSFSVTFTKPGTFLYSCTIHPTMKGTVVVRSAGVAPPFKVALSGAPGRGGKLIRVQAPRPHAKVLLEAHAGSGWTTIARGQLSSRGTATLTYRGAGSSHPLRVVVLGLHGERPLVSRTLHGG